MQMENFKDIYENGLVDVKEQYIESSNGVSKPIMVKGLISPGSKICIQPIFGIEFGIDEKGMNTIIEMFQEKWNMRDENERKQLLHVLTDIYSVADDYLGGHGNLKLRKKEYLDAENNCLNLSDIQGKKIGLCVERALIAHQLFSLLDMAQITHYESLFVNSHLTINSKEPHSFIILKHKTDSTKQYLFDVENPLMFEIPKKESTNKEAKNKLSSLHTKYTFGLALYPMNAEEFEAFKEGKSLELKSIYEQSGWKIADEEEKRWYGSGEKFKEKDDREI